MNNLFQSRFNVIDCQNNLKACRSFLENQAPEELNRRGALLLRATGIKSEDDLDDISSRLISQKYSDYLGGVVPRSKETGRVFNSTELNRLFKLKLHNELAYQPEFPRYIGFFCFKAPLVAGQTPIAHEEDIRNNLGPSLLSELDQADVVYKRRYLSAENMTNTQKRFRSIFLSWQDSFQTEHRSEAERVCRDLGLNHSWGKDGSLEVESVSPFFRVHPERGHRVFLNQFLTQQYSKTSLGFSGYYIQRVLGIRRDNALRDSTLLNTGLNEKSVATSILKAHKQSEAVFHWREGDFLVLDNYQVLHGRYPYLGARRISVVMGN